jgi:hypothetical protein
MSARTATLGEVWRAGGLIALRCTGCGHRKLLEETKWRDKEGQAYIRKDATESLASLKFTCSKCESKDVEAVVPKSWDDAKAFLAGQNIRNALAD